MPAVEQAQQLFAIRGVGCGPPAEPSLTNRTETKSLAVSMKLDRGGGGKRVWSCWRYTAPNGVASKNRIVVLEELQTDARVNPVSSDQKIRLDRVAIREGRDHLLVALFVLDERVAKMN